MPPPSNLLWLESRLYQQGYQCIAGVDEVGRGCLAGPVFAAAVIFPQDFVIPGVDDSKKLSPWQREKLYPEIVKRSVAWSVAQVEAAEIDIVNIHQASLRAMVKAVQQLATVPEFVLIDGRFLLPMTLPQQPVIKGDSLSHSIAAASIVAKVSRDRWMTELAARYPEFSFECHKGYGTKKHLAAIREHGLTPLHRRSFSIKT